MAAAVLAGGLPAATATRAAAVALPPPPSCPGSERYPTASAGYGIPIANRIVNGTLTEGSTKVTNINATICGILRFPSLSADIPAADIHFMNPANLTADGVVDVGTVDSSADGPSTAVTAPTPAANGGLVFTLTAEARNVVNIGDLSRLTAPKVTLPKVTVPTTPKVTVPTTPKVTVPTTPKVTVPTTPKLSPPTTRRLPTPTTTLPGVPLPGALAPPARIQTAARVLPATSVSCVTDFAGTFNTDPARGGSPLVGPLTGAQGTAYAPDGSASLTALVPADPGNSAQATFCPILSQLLGTKSSTTVSFKAPLDFYSTLTSFP